MNLDKGKLLKELYLVDKQLNEIHKYIWNNGLVDIEEKISSSMLTIKTIINEIKNEK